VLQNHEVPYQAYISQISYLLFLKMDDERPGLVASGLIKCEASAVPEDCRWPILRDLQGEEPSGGGRSGSSSVSSLRKRSSAA
jgi:type I restriction enzyme M protein